MSYLIYVCFLLENYIKLLTSLIQSKCARSNNDVIFSQRVDMSNIKYERFVSYVFFIFFYICCLSKEFEEKCESAGEVGVSGVCVMSGR